MMLQTRKKEKLLAARESDSVMNKTAPNRRISTRPRKMLAEHREETFEISARESSPR